MDDAAICRAGHVDVEPVAVAQPPDVEVLLHRVGRREQSDPGEAVAFDGLRGGVGDVDEGDVGHAGDRVGDLVHRVGAEHEQLGAGAREHGRFVREPVAGLFPPAVALEPLDLGEVDRAQDAVGRVKAAEAVANELVDQPVVLGRGLPAHPAEQADALHRADRASAAPQEPADGGHHLFGALVLLVGFGADHAGVGVSVEQPERDLVQCGLGGA